MPNQKNIDQVAVLQDKIAHSQSVTIIDYSGTSGAEQVQLRRAVKEAGGEVFVTKNTLINIAFGRDELQASLSGMNALVFSNEDPVAALKKVVEFQEETEKLELKQGFMDDRVLSTEEVIALSKLPGKDELIATLISRLNGPGYGLVNVLKGGQRNLVYALKAIAEQKQQAA